MYQCCAVIKLSVNKKTGKYYSKNEKDESYEKKRQRSNRSEPFPYYTRCSNQVCKLIARLYLFKLFFLRKHICLFHPCKQLFVQIRHFTDYNVRCPSSGIRLCLFCYTSRFQRIRESKRTFVLVSGNRAAIFPANASYSGNTVWC